jgi:NitT/TauT family transport system ATP-binding protein
MPNASDSNNLSAARDAARADGAPVIVFDKVSKIFDEANAVKEVALRDASFSVRKGEFLCIIGPSGGGKSTILKIIAGLERETSGRVTKPEHISMVFQSGALFPWMTVFDNVALALEMKGAEQRTNSAMIKATAEKYIEMVGLASMVEKYPRDLSGGQRQRVGIARALATDPDVLLLDEPFSALDPKTTEELHQDLIKIWTATGKTIVMVSHLIEEAVSLADQILLIKNYTVEHTFLITLTRPRRENEAAFVHEVIGVRHEFFK